MAPLRWIWPFELLEQIGSGGMGEVYRARSVINNEFVAVKLLPDDVAADAKIVARFAQEMEVLKQLRHPNIVRCFGGVCESKQRFYAMELVEGGTLSGLLRERGRLSWETAIEFGLQICEALQFAHSKGVIHRDVKPANFLLTKDRQLKLSDFGIATVAAGQRLTAAGRTVGTFHYMAPEQIKAKYELTYRADLYALGCVLFELVSGHPPFEAENPVGVLHMHLKNSPPRLIAEIFDCPAELDQIVQDLLKKNPADRPQSAAEVAQRLESCLVPGKKASATPRPITSTPSALRTAISSTISSLSTKSAVAEADDAFSPEIPSSNTLVRTLAILASGLSMWLGYALFVSGRHSPALIEWKAATQNSNKEIAVASVASLGRLCLEQADLVDVVAQLTTDARPEIRAAAVNALANLGSEGRRFIGELNKLEREDPSVEVRTAASSAQGRIKTEAGPSRSWPTSLWFGLTILIATAASWFWPAKPAGTE